MLDAVSDVSLSIRHNETLGLVGESGSGKSTFGQLIMGLLDRSAGEISYEGEVLPVKRTIENFAKQASRMQMVFQNPFSSFNPRMTVSDILKEPLYLGSLVRDDKNHQQVALQWIEKVGLLPDHLNRYPHEFSGGQRQRIAIARALINEPKFLVCDEPVSALDLSVQAQIINMLVDLKRSMGLTLLFIAHDLSLVRYISDRIAVMYRGNIVEIGPTQDVYNSPKHPYTQRLIRATLVVEPKRKVEKEAGISSGSEKDWEGSTTGCVFAARCPHVFGRCRIERPILRSIADTSHQLVACHLDVKSNI